MLSEARQPRLGVDLVQVRRIVESVEQFGDRFLQRVYTPQELEYCYRSTSEAPARLAARFAAKEAVIKALQPLEHPLPWRDIEVSRSASGACGITLHGAARAYAERDRIGPLALSLSHEGEYAIAVVSTTVPSLTPT